MDRERHTESWNTEAFRNNIKPSEMELPENYEHHLTEKVVMDDMEHELGMFCNQARLPVVHVGHQPIHQNVGSGSVLTTRCTRAMVALHV